MKKSVILVFAFMLLALSSFAAQMQSESYKQSVIVSEGGDTTTSSSYKNSIATGIINSVVSSSSYINRLGFFHTLMLADGQFCTSAAQCEGGFCCSSSCASSSCPTAAGGGGGGAAAGGGGGGLFVEIIKDFSVSPSSIEEQLTLGAASTRTITIKNTGNVNLDFVLSVVTIEELVSLSETSFSLESGQEKNVDATIIGKKLGSYLGEIKIKGDVIEKSISVVANVESKDALFDVKLDIPSAYKKIGAGEELKAQITLLNIGPARKVDVTATYIIKNKLGGIVHESSETFAVESQLSFVKSFKLSESLPTGDYLIVVEVRYQDSFAVSSEIFSVVSKEEAKAGILTVNIKLIGFIVLVGFGVLFAYTLVPRLRAGNLEKCRKAINDAAEAIGKNDLMNARNLYAGARSIYIRLEPHDKREVYNRLMDLYRRLK